MPAQNKCGYVFDRHVKFISEEVTEASAVQNASHADDFVMRQARKFAQGPDHRVQRIGDADHKRIGAIGFDAFANGLHHFEVDADEVIAAHPRLARNTGGNDHNIAACDIGVIIGALKVAVKAINGGSLRQIERLTSGHSLGDIEQDNIAHLFHRSEVSQSAADHASANEGNFVTSH